MNWEELITKFGLPLAGLIIVTYAFISGKVVPRMYYDEERKDRVAGEERFDRSMDLNESLLAELRKAKDRTPS